MLKTTELIIIIHDSIGRYFWTWIFVH